MTSKHAMKSSLICAVIFTVIHGIYAYNAELFSNKLWYVFLGFMPTFVLGAEVNKMKNYYASLLTGVGFAFLGIGFSDLMSRHFPISSQHTEIFYEFVSTFFIMFFPGFVLAKSWFNIIPMIFVGMISVYSTQDISTLPVTLLSVFIGSLSAILYKWIDMKIEQKS
ncbi:MAG: DUF1097 domain-containing protein [Lachnospiraceae bacterium]|nr:DUF1097 domain-containing protein [Lachnospiraceae bacterium]